ncbi:MAG: HIT domain-containing protein, partial [Brachymonas sp.]|nr:HIT domain-containing protein [Brachymonas sp.]
ELLMREHVQPAKMNLATLGNVVPHLHWHLIARFDWDSHFPNPVWGAALRTTDMQQLHSIESKLPALEAAMAAYLAQQEA